MIFLAGKQGKKEMLSAAPLQSFPLDPGVTGAVVS